VIDEHIENRREGEEKETADSQNDMRLIGRKRNDIAKTEAEEGKSKGYTEDQGKASAQERKIEDDANTAQKNS